MSFLSGMPGQGQALRGGGLTRPLGLSLPLEEPQILAAVQWHVCIRKQARDTSVDLGLGPEPPVLFLRAPWPQVTDYHHHHDYLKGVS